MNLCAPVDSPPFPGMQVASACQAGAGLAWKEPIPSHLQKGGLSRMRNSFRLLSLCLASLCSLGAAGCIILPIRTPTVIQNPNGEKQLLPRFALVPGVSTRQQVEDEYKAFSVDSGAPNLFWGRFRKSQWYFIVAVGGLGAADVGGGRTWGTYNILVTFDRDGSVKTSEIVRDSQLIDRLVAMHNNHEFPPFDFSQPVTAGGWSGPAPSTTFDLDLSPGGVVVTRRKPGRVVHKVLQPRPPEVFQIPLAQIAVIKTGYTEDANAIPVTIRFAEKTQLGTHVSFVTRPAGLLTLVRCIEQVRPQNLGGKGTEPPNSPGTANPLSQ